VAEVKDEIINLEEQQRRADERKMEYPAYYI